MPGIGTISSGFVSHDVGIGYAAGYFLASDVCERKTFMIQDGALDIEGKEVVLAGTVFRDALGPIGIVYENVDITNGPMPGSVVTKGTVYKGRIFPEPNEETMAALSAAGIDFITNDASDALRPY